MYNSLEPILRAYLPMQVEEKNFDWRLNYTNMGNTNFQWDIYQQICVSS